MTSPASQSEERTPPGTCAAYRHFRDIPTRWMDNDVYGHVNNVVYYSFFDTVVNAYLVEAGLLDIERSPVIGLVVETACRYFKPVSFPGRIAAGLRVDRIGTSSVRYAVGIFREGEDDAAAEGHFVHVYVDRATRRATPLAPEMREGLSRLIFG